jgi:hypothetical protein
MAKTYTADQLRKKYAGKYIDVYPLHYNVRDSKTGNYVTVYEVRGVSKTVKENYQTVEEILGN